MGPILTTSNAIAQFEYIFSLVCLGDTLTLTDELNKYSQRHVQLLLEMKDNDKMNCMNLVMYAAHYGKADVLKILLAYKPNLSRHDSNGRDVLHHAVISQDVKTVELLVDKVDVNGVDGSLTSKLHEATQRGNEEIVQLLLKQGAKVNVIDIDDVTPLHLAVDLQNLDIVKLLMKRSDPNAKDKWGWTPMHIAAAHNSLDILQYLISQGGHINIPDKCGNTPLKWAKEAKSDRTINYLRKSGAKLNEDKNKRRQFQFTDLGSVSRL